MKFSVVSASRAVLDMPMATFRYARVLSSHKHVCNIELAADRHRNGRTTQIISLTDAVTGNGPLNIVLDDFSGVCASDLENTEISLSRSRFRFGETEFSLQNAVVWDPSPDWHRLRTRCALSTKRRDWILEACRRRAPPGSLLELLPSASPPPMPGTFSDGLFSVFSKILQRMETGGRNGLRDGAASLVGLGNGLTPAGDDFLLGIMLFSWLRRDLATRICQPLANLAQQRTTRLSACLLSQFALGRCSAGWHAFFESIATNNDALLEQSIASLLSYGHTSGGDALAGFIWADRHADVIA